MRTTVLDVLRLAWRLIRMKRERCHLRIGQILINQAGSDPHLYNAENGNLISALKRK